MAHFSRLSRIVVDAPPDAHDAEIAFWSGALASPFNQVTRFPNFHWARLPGDGNAMLLQRLGDGSPRLHLDIHTTDRAAEVTRREQLGATVVDSSQEWTIMCDPAGLLFCVVPDASLDSTNANAWP